MRRVVFFSVLFLSDPRSLRGNAGLLPFVGAVTRPFVAELWAMGARLELTAAAAWPAFFVVELCASMAAALRSLHAQNVCCLDVCLGFFSVVCR